MLNAKLRCRFATIKIIACSDTPILHFEYCILHLPSIPYERKYRILDTLISNVTVVTMNPKMDVLFGAYIGIEDGKIVSI